MIYFQNMNRTMENYVHYLGKNTEACVKDELLIFISRRRDQRPFFFISSTFLHFLDFVSWPWIFVSFITFLTQEKICEACVSVIIKTTVFGDMILGLSPVPSLDLEKNGLSLFPHL